MYVTSLLFGYRSGIFNDPECVSNYTVQHHINHAVMIVGFNTTESGQDYWIMRNQWGSQWGINGYFYFPRGLNYCNLLATYYYSK